MGIGWEIGSGVAGAAAGIYDLFARYEDRQYQRSVNQRDFDYQKALQQQIFEREDNAVQRRRADLESAGLNPNLAAGSAAGAGSVVGRSSTSSLPSAGNPVGTALDMAMASAQLKAQNTQQKILENQEKKSKYEAFLARSDAQYYDLENVYNSLGLMYQLGLTNDTYLKVRDNGTFDISLQNWDPGYYTINNTPLQNQLEWQWKNSKNAADMLQKDVDFYTADKIANYLGIGASIFSGAGSGYLNFNKSRNYRRR